MQTHRLTLVGVACLVLAGAIAIPHEAPSTRPSAEAPAHQNGRVFLSSEDSKRAASAGLLPEGTESIIVVRAKLKHGDWRWNEHEVPPGKVHALVNLRTQMISVFRGGHEIGTAVVLFGAEGKDSPAGSFPVLAKIEDHISSTYDAPMPFTMRLTDDGVAVHGSDVRLGALGEQASRSGPLAILR